MTTLAQFESQIYREIHQTLSTEVRNAVLESVRFYQSERFWFNEAQANFNISLSSVYVLSNLIPKMVKIDHMKFYQGTTPYTVYPQSWDYLEHIDDGNTTASAPDCYAVHHEMLRFYPTPSATSSVVVTYHKAITLTSSGTSSTVWTNEAADLIRHRAKGLLYANVLLDPAQAQVEATLEGQALQRLFSRTTKMLSPNRIKKYL